MFVTAQQIEKQMPDATWLLSDEPEMESSLRFHTPEYFWFSLESLEFMGFELLGNQYQEIVLDARAWRWSQVLGLYLSVESGKLRYFTHDGDLVLTPEAAISWVQLALRDRSTVTSNGDRIAVRTRTDAISWVQLALRDRYS